MAEPNQVKTKKAVTWKDLGVNDAKDRLGVIGTVKDRAREAGAKIVTEALMRPVEKLVEAVKSNLDVPMVENLSHRFAFALFAMIMAPFAYLLSSVTFAMAFDSTLPLIEDFLARMSCWALTAYMVTFGYLGTTQREREEWAFIGPFWFGGLLPTTLIGLGGEETGVLVAIALASLFLSCHVEVGTDQGLHMAMFSPVMPSLVATHFISSTMGPTVFYTVMYSAFLGCLIALGFKKYVWKL